jgi:hypothetical protein
MSEPVASSTGEAKWGSGVKLLKTVTLEYTQSRTV